MPLVGVGAALLQWAAAMSCTLLMLCPVMDLRTTYSVTNVVPVMVVGSWVVPASNQVQTWKGLDDDLIVPVYSAPDCGDAARLLYLLQGVLTA